MSVLQPRIRPYALALFCILALGLASSVSLAQDTATITINYPGHTISYTVPVNVETTVEFAMREAAVEGKFDWIATFYGSLNGFLITSIDGVTQGGGNNWFYCIDGAPANLGISQQPAPPGSAINWYFTSSFPTPPC